MVFLDTEHTGGSVEVSRELQEPNSPLLPIISEEIIEPETAVSWVVSFSMSCKAQLCKSQMQSISHLPYIHSWFSRFCIFSSLAVIMTKYGMNGKKDSQLVDTNYIKDGTESDTLDDPRLEKLWSKVSKVSRNWSRRSVFLHWTISCIFWERSDLEIALLLFC